MPAKLPSCEVPEKSVPHPTALTQPELQAARELLVVPRQDPELHRAREVVRVRVRRELQRAAEVARRRVRERELREPAEPVRLVVGEPELQRAHEVALASCRSRPPGRARRSRRRGRTERAAGRRRTSRRRCARARAASRRRSCPTRGSCSARAAPRRRTARRWPVRARARSRPRRRPRPAAPWRSSPPVEVVHAALGDGERADARERGETRPDPGVQHAQSPAGAGASVPGEASGDGGDGSVLGPGEPGGEEAGGRWKAAARRSLAWRMAKSENGWAAAGLTLPRCAFPPGFSQVSAAFLHRRLARRGRHHLKIGTLAPPGDSPWGKEFKAWAADVVGRHGRRAHARLPVERAGRRREADGARRSAPVSSTARRSPPSASRRPASWTSWPSSSRASSRTGPSSTTRATRCATSSTREFEAKGFTVLGWGDVGAAKTMSVGFEVHTPRDLQGKGVFSIPGDPISAEGLRGHRRHHAALARGPGDPAAPRERT